MSSADKGKGGPPPAAKGDGKGKAEAEQRKREKIEREKREAQEEIARCKEIEAKKHDLEARLGTLKGHEINTVPWDAAICCTHLSGGKGDAGLMGDSGIDIIELEGSTAVCARQGQSIITESIADALAVALDVRVARMRFAKIEENRSIKKIKDRWSALNLKGSLNLKEIEQYILTREPEEQEKLRAWSDGSLQKAVVEFVPGTSLDTASAILEDPPPGLFAGLGHICALDLLMNNMDRVPLPCWQNAGNLTNVIITAAGEAVGIDQQVNVIDQEGMDAYLSDVRQLANQVFQGSAPAITMRIRNAIKSHCGVEPADSAMEQLIEGMGTVLRKAVVEAQKGSLRDTFAATAAMILEEKRIIYGKIDIASKVAQDVAFVQQVVGAVVEAAEGRTCAPEIAGEQPAGYVTSSTACGE